MKKHDVIDIHDTAPRACADCVNAADKSPLTCALLCDEHGTPQLCHIQRLPGGPCGPEAVFWRQAEHGVANLILFPGERRVAFPKAGTFDGGSAA